MSRGTPALSIAMLLLAAVPVRAQTQTPPPERTWSLFASAYVFVVPDDTDYAQPLFTADRGHLHLEARYNYEARKTGSAWGGYNFSGGETVEWELTPMIGAVFGETAGVAPGYKGSIAWRRLGLYSESEYVIDAGDTADSFLYSWSELTFAPTEALRLGLVVQRTRAYKTDRDIQRGIIVGYSYKRTEFTACIFNPDEDKPAFAFSAGVRF